MEMRWIRSKSFSFSNRELMWKEEKDEQQERKRGRLISIRGPFISASLENPLSPILPSLQLTSRREETWERKRSCSRSGFVSRLSPAALFHHRASLVLASLRLPVSSFFPALDGWGCRRVRSPLSFKNVLQNKNTSLETLHIHS